MADRTHRPLERFWPYVEKPEEPTPEELAALDPELHETLFGRRDLPFSVTLVFAPFDGDGPAIEAARKSAEYTVVGEGSQLRHRARYFPGDALKLRDLFQLVSPQPGTEVLIDDKPIPFSRELWLPLIWFLLLD
jgi:hypothetical protein